MTRYVLCPHCGEMRGNSHHGRCIKDPAVVAMSRAIADDGTGGIVSQNAYSARQCGTAALAESTLLHANGDSWANVAAFLGLEFRRAQRTTSEQRRQIEELLFAELGAEALQYREDRDGAHGAAYSDRGLVVLKVIEGRNETRFMLR